MSRRNARQSRRGVGGQRTSFNPLSLTPFAWYRADTTDTATNFDLLDRTGNGHTLRQATAGFKPTIVQPSEIGGRSAIRFDGADDYLAAIDAASNYAFFHNGAGAHVFVKLIPRGSVPTNAVFLNTYTSGANTGLTMQYGAASGADCTVRAFNNAGGFTIDATAAGVFAVDTPVLVSMSYSEAASPEYDIRKNNVSGASGASATAPGANNPPAPLNLGRRSNGAQFCRCDVAEAFVFGRVLTIGESAALVAYLTSLYGP